MRKVTLICVLGALAACQSEEEAAVPAGEETAATVAPAEPVEPPLEAGTYEFTMPDGAQGRTVLNEDRTYNRQLGSMNEKGKVVEIDGETCFDPAGDMVPNRCYTIGEPGEDGMFAATPKEGEPVMARKVG